MITGPKVMLISNEEPESEVLEKVLSEYVLLQKVATLCELQTLLNCHAFHAVFCGWSFHRGAHDLALEEIHHSCSNPPVIVFCQGECEQEWGEVAEAGAFDFLAPPLRDAIHSCLRGFGF